MGIAIKGMKELPDTCFHCNFCVYDKDSMTYVCVIIRCLDIKELEDMSVLDLYTKKMNCPLIKTINIKELKN